MPWENLSNWENNIKTYFDVGENFLSAKMKQNRKVSFLVLIVVVCVYFGEEGGEEAG